MTVTAILIFIGIPSIGLLAGLTVTCAVLLRWTKSSAPSSHYIASRHVLEPKNTNEEIWLQELDALKIPYRHTVC